MNQVIVISPDANFRSLIEKQCAVFPNSLPLFFDSLFEIGEALRTLSAKDTLIIDGDRINGPEEIILLVREQKENIQYIVVSSKGPVKHKDLVVFLRDRLSQDMEPASRYVAMSLQTLNNLKVVPFPLFISLSENNFVQRFPAFEAIDPKIVEEYQGKGIKEFFFDRSYSHDFTDLLLKGMMDRLTKSQKEKNDEQVKSEIFSTVREIVASFGMKPRTLSLCEALMNEVAKDVHDETNSDMVHYMEELRTRSELNFTFRQVRLTSYIAGQLLPESKKDSLKDLIFAAFFCDISIMNPDHIHYRTQKDLLLLNEDDREEVRSHASFSASMVMQGKNFSEKGALIIRQHHGDLEGKDFPLTVHPDIDELSKYFIVAQEIAYALLTNHSGKVWKVCQDLIAVHRGTSLEEIFITFEKSLLKRARREQVA